MWFVDMDVGKHSVACPIALTTTRSLRLLNDVYGCLFFRQLDVGDFD